jgi:hypothetical protein
VHKTQSPSTSTKKKKKKKKKKKNKKKNKKKTKEIKKKKNYLVQHSVLLLNVAAGWFLFHDSRCFKP